MLKTKAFATVLLTALCTATFPCLATDKAAKADELYQQAVIPWEQGRNSGWELMLKAADAGNIDAQCWIAKSSMKSTWVWSETTYKYFKMAASQDGLCGMLALSTKSEGGVAIMGNGGLSNEEKDELRAKLINRSKALADNGNIDGIKMYAFLQAIKDGNDEGYCKWMEKAAKLGDPDAMNQLAGSIHDGCGWHLIPGSRDKAVRYWTEQAANHGNPRAMEVMSSYAEKDKDIVGMLAWLERAANTGNINSIRNYSTYLMGGDEFTIPIPADMQSNKKAYAWLYVLTHQLPPETEESAYSRSVKELSILEKKLSANEMEEAKSWANEWMKTHQVRSYFLEFGM